MATPKYDAILAKVRDWSNKPESNTIPDSVIASCLSYSADECYSKLRIPPLEITVKYTVDSGDNPTDTPYTTFFVPEDLTQFNFIRTFEDSSHVFNEITDKRTFFDSHSEKYNGHSWMWMDNKVFIRPQLTVGDVLELNYYRRLPALDAQFSVIPVNYIIGLADADQPYVTLTGVGTDTPLYFSTSGSIQRVFASSAEAAVYDPTVTTKYYVGKEVDNWLRDSNERLLIWGALFNLGAYLFDDKMEARFKGKFEDNILTLNKEEKWRRASGGNVRMNFNSNGMI
jgi:hypothetical protein